jgi:hypothetical protein
MRPGESFTFQAVARDDQGCRVNIDATFDLLDPGSATLVRQGTLTIPKTGKAGNLRILATVGEQSVEVSAKVVSADEFEELMAGGGYGVLGESQDGASITLSSSHVEFDKQEDGDQQQRSHLLWIVIGLLLALGAVAVTLVFRGRKSAAGGALPKSLREELPDEAHESKADPGPTAATLE